MSRRRGFTLIELLVVVAIIGLLIAILLPSLGKARKRAKTVQCLSNTRSMGIALQFYIADWKKSFSFSGTDTTHSWTQLLMNGGQTATASQPYVQTGGYGGIDKMRVCPEAPRPADGLPAWSAGVAPSFGTAVLQWANSAETGPGISGSYGVNGWIYNTSGGDTATLRTMSMDTNNNGFYALPNVFKDSAVPVMADCNWRHVFAHSTNPVPTNLQNPGPSTAADVTNHPIARVVMDRHDKAINVAFYDGHSETVKLGDLWTLEWSANWTPTAAKVVN